MNRAARDVGLDWLRGLVMVLMVLDHARDFIHGTSDDPTDLTTTTPILFATRWVTHFCAPTFVFLAGTSAFLYAEKRTTGERTKFLLTRGLWLIVLELTIIRFGWIPDPLYRFSLFAVFWALGISMIALAGLAYLPPRALAIVGGLGVVLHNLLDGFHPSTFAWTLMHEPGMLEPFDGRRLWVMYPAVPWIFVMALGYAFGPIAKMNAAERAVICRRLGLALIAAFVALRASNLYGDPLPWTSQHATWLTVVSFLNCEKYPPSLCYLLMTLGPGLLVLSYAPREETRRSRPFVVFGRVPLFFYVAHLYLLHYPAIVVAFAMAGAAAFGPNDVLQAPLWVVYVAWLAALFLLYPACRWYGRLKARSASPWLSYL